MQNFPLPENARAQVSRKFHLWLDEPRDWSQRVRRLRLSGWCVAKHGAPLVRLRARLRGEIFPGVFDRARPEVAAYLALPDAPRWCGFTVDVVVPFGRGRLELQVARADGAWQKAFACDVRGPLRESATERKLWRALEEREASMRFAFHLDRPANLAAPASRQFLAGWCLPHEGSPIAGVRARVDERVFPGRHGLPREDLPAIFPGKEGAGAAGFAVAVEVPRGRHALRLEALLVRGGWHPFFLGEVEGTGAVPEPLSAEDALLFAPDAAAGSRFNFWIDRPTDWSAPQRHLHVAGWCFARSGPDVAELRGRLGRKIFPAHYGILRPDVAVANERGAAALRCGFRLEATIPWGRRQFLLEARSEAGKWETFFTTPMRGALVSRRQSDATEAVGNYAEWIALYDRLTSAESTKMRAQIAGWSSPPLFSVLLPVYNPEVRWLRRALASVRAQLYPHWELCVVDDASTDPRVARELLRAARGDPRIRFHRREHNGHISAASNDALAMARGEFIALLDHDDELAPLALYCNALALQQTPGLQLLYSDEDKLDAQGRRTDPYFKSDWNPDLLCAQNYVSHLGVYRTELVRRWGAFGSVLKARRTTTLSSAAPSRSSLRRSSIFRACSTIGAAPARARPRSPARSRMRKRRRCAQSRNIGNAAAWTRAWNRITRITCA